MVSLRRHYFVAIHGLVCNIKNGYCIKQRWAQTMYSYLAAVSYTHLDVYKRQTFAQPLHLAVEEDWKKMKIV